MNFHDRLHGLYVITDEALGGGHLAIAGAALAAGVKIIQLRDKSTPLAQLLPIGRELRRMTLEAGALLLINDRIDVSLVLGADGVHLGPDDMPVREARALLSPKAVIGVSCGDAGEAREAEAGGADYIGAGAVFATSTKSDAGAPIGLAGLGAIASATRLPVAAIGGIGAGNIASVCGAGAAMACAISAIAAAGDAEAMRSAAAELIELCRTDQIVFRRQ